MSSTIINALAIIIGTLAGILLKSRLGGKLRDTVSIPTGLIAFTIGLGMAMGEGSVIIVLFSLIIGGLLGNAIGIDEKMNNLGVRFVGKDNASSFVSGFVNSSILFCAGSMAIVGAFEASMGKHDLILTKSVMDGFMAVVFASSYGICVIFSSLVVLAYQGIFVLASSFLADVLGDVGIDLISKAGGVLLLMLSLGILNIKKTNTCDFLPALVIAPVLGIALEKIS